MLAAQLKQLLEPEPGPHLEGLGAALEVVDGLDRALVHGLGRVGEAQVGALTAFAAALAGSPLRDRVSEAVDKVCAGSIGEEHLTALAGGRAALLGAVHDAHLARLDGALGRTRAEWAADLSTVDAPVDNLLAGCRSWLSELAITGWHGAGPDLVSASGNAIQAAYGVPELRRLAVLLDGLAAELAASAPIAAMEQLPARRWADLWSRGLLLAQSAGAPRFAPTEVSGRLLLLGVDVHEHETAVQLQAHGVLESGGAPPRLVRVSVSAGKANTVNGVALWRLFTGYQMLLNGLAKQCSLEISGMPLLPSGDLLWREDRATVAEAADPFAAARVLLAKAVAPAVPPLERHPVRIAEPVLIEGYTVQSASSGGASIDLGGSVLELDLRRLPGCGPLTADQVATSTACLGLLRWDGGRWLLQPLAVQTLVKKKPVTVHTGQGAAEDKPAKAGAGDPVSVLRERAGRLLRK